MTCPHAPQPSPLFRSVTGFPTRCLLALAVLAVVPPLAMADVAGVEALPKEGLDGRNVVSSMIAADGTVVGMTAGSDDVVLWRPGRLPEFLGMDSLLGMNNLSPALSLDGTLVGVSHLWEDDDYTFHTSVMAWKEETGWLEITDLGLERPVVLNASPHGDALVGYAFIEAALYHPWIWRESSGVETLDVPKGYDVGDAWAVSADTRVVAGSLGIHDPDAWGFHTWDHAVRWVDGVPELLRDAHGRPASAAIRCNSDCSVIVGGGVPPEGGQGDPNWGEAWYWTEATGVVHLGELPGGAAPYYAIATSEDGSVIVGSYGRLVETDFGVTMEQHAFVWTPGHGLRAMDLMLAEAGFPALEGWRTSVATDITPDGRSILVGGWLEDRAESVLVTLDPQAPWLEPERQVLVSGAAGGASIHRIQVPEGARDLRVMTGMGHGDISLYLRHGAPPTRTEFDRSSTRIRTVQAVRELHPEPGIWYVGVMGDGDFQDVRLWARYDAPDAPDAPTVEPVGRQAR